MVRHSPSLYTGITSSKNDIIGATDTDPGVGGNGGERGGGDQGDAVGQQNHQQGFYQSQVADHPTKAQTHDNAEDGQDRRGIDPEKSAELVAVFSGGWNEETQQ